METSSYINSNQEEIIMLEIDYRKLFDAGYAKGSIGNFSVSFAQTINLDSNLEYDMGITSILYNQPYPQVQDSYILYCSLVEQSRIGSGVGNVLHKTLTSYASSRFNNHGNQFYARGINSSSIIDWKKLNVRDFNTIDFIFISSSGLPYPEDIVLPRPTIHDYNLSISVAIRVSPTSKQLTSRVLGQHTRI